MLGWGGVRPHGLVDSTFCRSILSDCTSLLTIFTSPTYWCASDANDVMSVAPQACVPKLSAAADRRKHIRTRSVRREPSTIFSSRVSSSLKYASCDRPQAGGGTPRSTVAIANTPSPQQRRRPPNQSSLGTLVCHARAVWSERNATAQCRLCGEECLAVLCVTLEQSTALMMDGLPNSREVVTKCECRMAYRAAPPVRCTHACAPHERRGMPCSVVSRSLWYPSDIISRAAWYPTDVVTGHVPVRAPPRSTCRGFCA
jgi:hypothetical protein